MICFLREKEKWSEGNKVRGRKKRGEKAEEGEYDLLLLPALWQEGGNCGREGGVFALWQGIKGVKMPRLQLPSIQKGATECGQACESGVRCVSNWILRWKRSIGAMLKSCLVL